MCASGGVLSLGDDVGAPQLTDEELAAIVDEAHRLGRKTAAHAHGDLAARAAVRAGIDSIEHGSFLTDETLLLMKAKGTYLVPTLLAGEWLGRQDGQASPEDRRQGRAAPSAARSDVVPPGAEGRRQDRVRHGRRRLAARPLGARVRPHGGPRDDARPRRFARRRRRADLLGLGGQIGTLEKGKEADIVAVPGDPAPGHPRDGARRLRHEGRANRPRSRRASHGALILEGPAGESILAR